MLTVRIKAEFQQVERMLSSVDDRTRNQVIARSLNRIGDSTKTEAVREIAAEFNITAGKVRERIKVRKAFAAGNLAVTIEVPSRHGKRALNLISFNAKEMKRGGVSVRIKRGTKATRGRNWFIIENSKTGGRFVAKRVGKKVEPVRTVDVGQMFNANKTRDRLLANISARFPREVEAQLRYAVSRR